MDHNTTACLSGNVCLTNEFGPVTLLSSLYNDTQYWNGVEIPTNYSIDQSTQTSGAKYTIDYSNYKARIITAWEIAQITGNLAWNEKNEDIMYFFDTHTTAASNTCKSGNTSGCKYGWLYDRTSTSCTTYGCLNNSDQTTSGYWTATSSAKGKIYSWLVYYSAVISNSFGTAGTSDSYGVRPVIEVLKSKLS